MNVSLQELRSLSDNLHTIPDDRPQWLKEMPYVTQPGSSYYQFIYELVKRHRPARVLEIGIDKAGSTMCLSYGNPSGKVWSMDISKESCENARRLSREHNITNLSIIQGDSLKAPERSGWEDKVDLLFLDSWHSFDQVYREYVLYRSTVKEGGIILFDDIRYSKEMAVAWDLIPDPKIDLSELHHSGFGACKVDPSITPVSWESIREEAKRRYSA